MTREAFDAVLAPLIALKFAPATTDGHWQVLRQESEADLVGGVRWALRTRAAFPVPSELGADVSAARTQRAAAAVDTEVRDRPLAKPHTMTLPNGIELQITHLHEYHCTACSDSGWSEFWCGPSDAAQKPWHDLKECDRFTHHDGHAWAGRCPCAETNPVVLARRARQLHRAAERTERT